MPKDNETLSDTGYFQLALRGQEGDYPTLGEITAFLYNFNVLYEFSRLSVDPGYSDHPINQNTANRTVKRIFPKDQLVLQSLSVQSPIALIAAVSAGFATVTTLLAFADKLEKIVNIPINRQILLEQRDKLKLENEAAQRAALTDNDIKNLQRENFSWKTNNFAEI